MADVVWVARYDTPNSHLLPSTTNTGICSAPPPSFHDPSFPSPTLAAYSGAVHLSFCGALSIRRMLFEEHSRQRTLGTNPSRS